jgi:hypothetical protein
LEQIKQKDKERSAIKKEYFDLTKSHVPQLHNAPNARISNADR